MAFSNRLRELIDNKGVTAYRVAKDTGISQQLLAKYLNQGLVPKQEKLIVLANYFGISETWLRTGFGGESSQHEAPEIKECIATLSEACESIGIESTDEMDDLLDRLEKKVDDTLQAKEKIPRVNYSVIPMLPISAQGGSLDDFIVSVKSQDLEYVVSPIKDVDFVMTVAGDSMAPEYPSGSYIYIKKINHHLFIEWGKVYVLDTYNGTIIKEIHACNEEGYVMCHSVNPNPKFAPFRVKFDDINGMYKVLLCMATK